MRVALSGHAHECAKAAFGGPPIDVHLPMSYCRAASRPSRSGAAGGGDVVAVGRDPGDSLQMVWFDALRRWWIVPLLAALLGGTAGFLATRGAQPVALAALELHVDALDAQNLARESQAVLAQASKSEVFEEAGKAVGMTEADLRAVTDVSSVSDGLGINIRARAADPQQAVARANAVAAAAVAVSRADVQAQLKDLEKATTALVKTPAIGDASAEQARVARLGLGLADNQSRVVAQSNRLRELQRAEVGTVQAAASTSSTVLSGFLGGLLLGGLGVLHFGAKYGRLRSEGELGRRYPRARLTTLREMGDVLTEDGRAARRVLVLESAAHPLSDDVREAVRLARPPMLEEVAISRVGSTAYQQGTRDPDTVLLLPVIFGRTLLQDLDRQARVLRRQAFLVIDPEALRDSRHLAHAHGLDRA